MTSYIDIHSHLDHPTLLPQMESAIERARMAGVRHIITCGITPQTNRICLDLSRKYDIVECAMGLYPKDALRREIAKEGTNETFTFSEYDTDEEIDFIRKHKKDIVAISEIGLDFMNGESGEQRNDFRKMLDLAKDLDKPVIIHSRKAEQHCIEMMEDADTKKVVMHCFCGKSNLVERIVKNGWFLTLPTSIVRAQQFQNIAKTVPITQLFCETDSPYLSPFKELPNEPAFVVESYRKLAEIKGMTIEETAQNVYMNWQRLFT